MRGNSLTVTRLTLLVFTASIVSMHCRTPEAAKNTEPAEAVEAPAQWEVAEAARREIDLSVRAEGVVKPGGGSEVKVGSRISGIVSRLHVKVGDRVAKGQLLAELDPTELQAQLNQAKATLNNAKARLEYARPDVDRKRKLFKDNLISQVELDRAERSYEIALSEVDQAEANLEYAEIQVRYTRIYAPIPGVVASVSTQEGETIAASFAAPTFVTILNLDRLEVWAYVDESDIGRIGENHEAVVRIDTYPGTEFRGSVSTIYPKAEILEDGVKYVAVVTISPQADKPLRPEMTASISFPKGVRSDVLTVPDSAVFTENGEAYVHVLRDEKPEKQRIQTGIRGSGHTEILNGLEEGDRVVLGDPDLRTG